MEREGVREPGRRLDRSFPAYENLIERGRGDAGLVLGRVALVKLGYAGVKVVVALVVDEGDVVVP